ncbi:leucine-rich repeat extensin-like protein 6 [Hibiscus syriacus]|uniref:leucine-rich repeat extensin-like protein 6 n=1 Tax=Hibiscus syriacus TaxID=106335 RepID=UPI001924B923|nr:leucine-rich repeat extensin-like protein 6 [Hibiscus syriacus]
MAMVYSKQMLPLLAAFTLLLVFPSSSSTTITTAISKDEVKCDTCTPVVLPPPPPAPVVIPCPPPPAPPSPPPPSPPLPPPACPTCCTTCQTPSTSEPTNQQPGVIGGAVYPPPYYHWAGSSKHSELKPFVSIVFISLSATFSFF